MVQRYEQKRENGLPRTPIDKQTAKEVASKLTEKDVYFEVYTNKGSFTIDADKAVSILVDIIVSANPEVNLQEIRVRCWSENPRRPS